MSQYGIVLDIPTIRRLRADFRKLSEDLDRQLKATEQSIETVATTWKDDNFKRFKDKFDQDKERLRPLSKKVAEYEDSFLRVIESKLQKYINRY